MIYITEEKTPAIIDNEYSGTCIFRAIKDKKRFQLDLRKTPRLL